MSTTVPPPAAAAAAVNVIELEDLNYTYFLPEVRVVVKDSPTSF
jgi:hypothetical protein